MGQITPTGLGDLDVLTAAAIGCGALSGLPDVAGLIQTVDCAVWEYNVQNAAASGVQIDGQFTDVVILLG